MIIHYKYLIYIAQRDAYIAIYTVRTLIWVRKAI